MTVRVNKSITINGRTIELSDLVDRPWIYLDLIRTQFKESTFKRKLTESPENHLKRLFALLYGRQNRANLSSNRDSNQSDIAKHDDPDLKFDIIRRSNVYSRIAFKNSGNTYRLKNEYIDLLINAAKSKHSNGFKVIDKFIGVELEFIGKRSRINEFCDKIKKIVGCTRFSNEMRYYHNDGNKWVLGIDGSVHPVKNEKRCESDMQGFELTSPILELSSEKDMSELRQVCELISNTFSAYTNRTCGTHVHMSFKVDKNDMKPIKYKLNENDLLRHFVQSYRNNEASLFDKLVPLYRRESQCKYCEAADYNYMGSRYRKINVTNFKPNREHLHLEFRQLDGTLDPDRIILWSRLQSLFVDNVMKTWNDSKKNHKAADLAQLNLEDIIVSDVFGVDTSEQLMKMANMIK